MNVPNSSTILPFAPRPAQRVIYDLLSEYRFVTAVCHRRLGKTRGAIAWLCLEGLQHTDAMLPFRGYYFAPTKDQARKLTWHFFKQMLRPLEQQGRVTFHETSLSITLPNDGMIYLQSGEPDSVENVRGMYAHRVCIDELASWRNSHVAWVEIIRPALADTKGKALFIGTVKGLDLLFEFFQRGSDERFANWGSVMFKASETGILDEEEIAELLLEYENDPSAYGREFECDFFAETSDVMIPAKIVQPAIGGVIRPSEYMKYIVKIGIDPGITGDPTGICIRQGPMVHELTQMWESDHEILAEKLVPMIDQWMPTRIYIDNGRGEQLIKQLTKKLGNRMPGRIVPVTFNAQSPSASCYNFRTYMYWNARQWFQGGDKSIPNDKLLVQELTNQLLDDAENTGSILRLVPKKKIKAILKRSPNKSDSFVVTLADGMECSELVEDYAHEQLMRLIQQSTHGVSKNETYDPYNHLKNRSGAC